MWKAEFPPLLEKKKVSLDGPQLLLLIWPAGMAQHVVWYPEAGEKGDRLKNSWVEGSTLYLPQLLKHHI